VDTVDIVLTTDQWKPTPAR